MISYLMENRERMEDVRQMVVEVETQKERNQKRYYAKKARTRILEVGQKVLVLLPTSGSKLLAQWKCPNEVTAKMSRIDYKVILSKTKETVYHVDMLKEWFERESMENSMSDILACLNVISSLADSAIQKGMT